MSDIWSGIGVDVAATTSGGEWLYRLGNEVRGPIPFESLVGKLLAGELNPNTLVAREGGEFHEMARVAAFAPHVQQYQAVRAKKASTTARIVGISVALLVIAAAGGGGVYLWREHQRKLAAVEQERQVKEAALAREREALEKAPKMELVALVSLGTEEDVKIKSEPKPARPKRPGSKPTPEESKPSPGEEEMVMSCKLSQQDIFGTLKTHLAKINVCVEDEKTRDAANLPSTLELEFVVKPTGKVVEFKINDRHYRTGPMNNCMVKAFNTITFPTTDGSNCPVTIPIKIGK